MTILVLCAFQSDDWKMTKLGEHTDMVHSVTVSPDKKWIATGSNDNKVMIWDANSNKLVKELMCHSVAVTDVVFTSDRSTMITSGKDKLIRFWDTKTWKRLGEIAGHNGLVNDLVLTSDDKYVISCSDDYTIVMWDVASRKKVKEIGRHNSRVLSLDLSSDDKLLVSTSGDKMQKSAENLKIWNLESSRCTYMLDEETFAINSAIFNQKGSLIAYAGNFKDVRLINSQSGAVMAGKDVTSFGVNTLCMKGLTIYAGTTFDGNIAEWSIGSDVKSFKAHADNINRIALVNDDIVSVGSDGKVKRWSSR